MNKGEISAVVKVWSRLSGFEDHLCSLEAVCSGRAAWPFCTSLVKWGATWPLHQTAARGEGLTDKAFPAVLDDIKCHRNESFYFPMIARTL